MTCAPAYMLRPGDVIGESLLVAVQVATPTNKRPGEVYATTDGGYVLRIPALEPVVLTARVAYAPEPCWN